MLRTLLDEALAAAREAAGAVRACYRDRTVLLQKGEDNPLTEADLASVRVLHTRLRDRHPDFGWLDEETPDDGSWHARPWAWVVDPLDGTREFTRGIPEFVVSIGLLHAGRPVLGVLVNPVTGEVFAGAEGLGATLDGAPAQVSAHPSIEGARVACSRTEHARGDLVAWEGLDLVPVGSVAYKLGLVAAGRVEANFTPQPRNAWDIAGGVAIVLAAGGRVTDGRGRPLDLRGPSPLHTGGLYASNGLFHDALLRRAETA
ncbi:MAG: inositol monophosphatase [Pseudomonadota bacterium]